MRYELHDLHTNWSVMTSNLESMSWSSPAPCWGRRVTDGYSPVRCNCKPLITGYFGADSLYSDSNTPS